MNFDYLISLIKDPSKVQEQDSEELLKLTKQYPYFGLTRWLYLKSLKEANSLDFKKELKIASMHAPDRKKLYFFIHPEELQTEKRERTSYATGSYFDIIDNYNQEGSDSENKSNSLTILAKRLKEAKDLLHNEEQQIPAPIQKKQESKPNAPTTTELNEDEDVEEINLDKLNTPYPKSKTNKTNADLETVILEKEQKVKELITKEKKYKEAIALLDELILINPKKSVYFADQIHFLEKILEYNQ